MNRIEEIEKRVDSVPFVKDRNDIKYLLSALKTAQARAEAAENVLNDICDNCGWSKNSPACSENGCKILEWRGSKEG